MKHVIILFLLLCTLQSLAQSPIIGIKGGVSWSDVFTEVWATDYFRTGFTGGITYEQQLKNGILVGAELLYQQRGYEGKYRGNVFSCCEKENYKYYDDYIAVPLKAGYKVGNKLSGFANIGLVPAILIKSKAYSPVPGMNGETTYDFSEFTKKMDLAGLAEIGGNLKITHRLLISASFAFQYSFTSSICNR